MEKYAVGEGIQIVAALEGGDEPPTAEFVSERQQFLNYCGVAADAQTMTAEGVHPVAVISGGHEKLCPGRILAQGAPPVDKMAAR